MHRIFRKWLVVIGLIVTQVGVDVSSADYANLLSQHLDLS